MKLDRSQRFENPVLELNLRLPERWGIDAFPPEVSTEGLLTAVVVAKERNKSHGHPRTLSVQLRQLALQGALPEIESVARLFLHGRIPPAGPLQHRCSDRIEAGI